ncbi:EamA family transporter [Nonomuraea sp. NPDC050328]|uniref:EamA family transporter n=1 Tax=Nonomuraea sp. NPDC050328 TaxID=3364361 RepID=UPI0037A310D0
MLAIALALGAGLGWGTSDFLGGLKSRALPLPSVLLLSQATALALLATATAVRGSGPPGLDFLGQAAIAGLGETLGIAALYRGFAVGTMSIVAPVAAAAPLVPLLAGLAAGQVPGSLQFTGMALAVLGLIITSRRPTDEAGTRPQVSILYGMLAALGFGAFFLTLHNAGQADIGWSLLTARLTTVTVIASVIALRRHRVAVRRSDLPALAAIGVLIVAADAQYAFASILGPVGVAAVLGSLHTVVTIALARIILKERLSRLQAIGVGVVLAGVLILSLA